MPDEDMASRQQLAEEAEEKVSDPLVVENNDEEWEEDEDGNFVKKGE